MGKLIKVIVLGFNSKVCIFCPIEMSTLPHRKIKKIKPIKANTSAIDVATLKPANSYNCKCTKHTKTKASSINIKRKIRAQREKEETNKDSD